MAIEVYRHHSDISMAEAMLVWTRGKRVGIVPHPDTRGISDGFQSSVGACFADWRTMGPHNQIHQLMIEAWHVAAFYDIPANAVHQALLAIPEYRNTLAQDCLPKEFWHERE